MRRLSVDRLSERKTARTSLRTSTLAAGLRRGRQAWRQLAIVIALLSTGPSGLLAETLEAGGLSFSDELGGFRLISATGSGRASDPIVLVEEITGMGPAVLTIRPSGQAGTPSSTSSPPSLGVLMRSLIKVVVNKSAWRWSGFDLELRGAEGRASLHGDGLSFDQIRMASAPLRSDLFAAARTEDEPFDRLRFDQGRVKPEQAVRLAFNLVDINTRPVFYLAQQPIVLLADAARR